MSFLEALAQKGVIKENQISEVMRNAEKKYGGDIDDAVAELGLDADTLLALKSEYYGIPAIKIDSKNFSNDALKYIPEDSAAHYKFAPLRVDAGVLQVGVLDPANTQALDALQFISAKSNLPFKIYLISKADFAAIMDNYKGATGEVEQALSQFDIDVSGEEKGAGVEVESQKIQDTLKPGEEEKIVEEAPIIKIVAVLLRTAVEGNASDIHIENTGEKVKVRFRVDGVLHTSLFLPMNVYNGVVARIKILAKLRLDEKRKPQDGGFSAKIENRKIDFRVSTMPAYYGEKVVLRILDSEKGVKALDALDLSEDNLKTIRETIGKPYGLVLITGPTGSGKTTTLYSMLRELDREKSNVVSLEDPVEYHIPDVSQSQVMPEIGYTFASGLRSILRQDPDIIMVGEIRDKETAGLAINAALTGHLVFSTLHTNNAIGAIPRLIDMGVDPYLISPTVVLVMAQRLVRLACEESKKEVPIDASTKIMIDKQFADLPAAFKKKIPVGDKMYDIVPSPACPAGTKGRVAVYEMLKVDKDMQALILKNPSEADIYKLARSKGMMTMMEDAIVKSLKGEIPFQEVYTLGNFEE
jgi:type IV pilus assembly protein PilB